MGLLKQGAWQGFILLFFSLLLCLTPLLSSGATIQHLYSARVAVADESAQAHAAATAQALQDVLVKVSGDSRSLLAPALAQALLHPQRYVKSFSYQSRELPALPVSHALPLTIPATTALDLVISFEPDAIQTLLSQVALPIWEANRPSFLLWITRDDNQVPVLLGQDDAQAPEVSALARVLAFRGVPALLPVIDLDVLQQVTPAVLAQPDIATLAQAAQPYATAGQLIIRLHYQAAQWQATATAVVAGQTYHNSVSDGDLATLYRRLLNPIVDAVAQDYAVTINDDSSDSATLVLDQIKGYHDFQRAMTLLQSAKQIQSVSVASLDRQRIIFDLVFKGGVSKLQQAFTLLPQFELQAPIAAARMVPLTTQTTTAADATVLDYRWLP